MEDPEAAKRVLCSPEREVSAHYLIRRDGDVIPLVDEEMRAWHAGSGRYRGEGDVNSRSIGIELDNTGLVPFAAPMMDVLDQLLPEIMARWELRDQDVIGHSCMAPGRKIDPGPRFDWARLARQGLATWPEGKGERPVDEARFEADMIRYGFPKERSHLMLQSFRLRFHPRTTGPLNGRDCAIAAEMADRFGA